MSLWVRNFFAGILVVLVAFVLLEIVLRLLPIEPKADYQIDKGLGWRFFPNAPVLASNGSERLNERGWRGPLALETKSRLRVACLGDSCTYGVFIKKSKETYPGQLQYLLKENHRFSVEVLNFGLNGYNTFQGVELLRDDVAKAKPDVAILYYGWNDRTRVVGYFNYPERIRFLSSIYFKSNTVRLFYLLTDGWLQNARYSRKLNSLLGERVKKHPLTLQQVEDNLHEFIKLSRDNNITPLFVTAPWGGGDLAQQRKTYASLSAASRRGLSPVDLVYSLHNIDQYNELVRRIARREGVTLVDLAELFEKIPEAEQASYFYPNDRMHPSEIGCRWIAKVLAPEVLRIEQSLHNKKSVDPAQINASAV